VAAIIAEFTPRAGLSRFDAWLDGQKWRLTIGEDAENLDTLRRSLYRRGKQLGLRVRIRVYAQRGCLEVQGLTHALARREARRG
jgi:hypothetical protein